MIESEPLPDSQSMDISLIFILNVILKNLNMFRLKKSLMKIFLLLFLDLIE